MQQGEFLATLLLDHETVEWKSFVEELVKSMANLDPSERVRFFILKLNFFYFCLCRLLGR